MIKVYIYGIVCPKTKKVMYVGKSKNPHKRLLSHFYKSKNNNPWQINPIHVWLKTFLNKKTKPTFIILEDCFKCNSIEKEIFWIEKYSELNKMLLNVNNNPNNLNNKWRPIRKHIGGR